MDSVLQDVYGNEDPVRVAKIYREEQALHIEDDTSCPLGDVSEAILELRAFMWRQ